MERVYQKNKMKISVKLSDNKYILIDFFASYYWLRLYRISKTGLEWSSYQLRPTYDEKTKSLLFDCVIMNNIVEIKNFFNFFTKD